MDSLTPPSGRLLFQGRTLIFEVARGEYLPARHEGEVLHLTFPEDMSAAALKAEVQTETTLWRKRQARRIFGARVAHWAKEMGVAPRRLILCAPRRRWGSCNAKNDIRLNMNLIAAAPEILDYVIVHELAHIPHKNHGPAFWAFVARFIPDWKTRRKLLKSWKNPDWLMG